MKTSTNQASNKNIIATQVNNRTCLPTHKWKRWMGQVSGGLAVSLCYCLLAATQAIADNFSFTKIVDNSSDFSSFSDQAINDNGTIVFQATPKEGGRGVYTISNGSITEIANSTQSSLFGFPSNSVNSFSNVDINNNDTVAFLVTGVSYPIINNLLITSQGGSLTFRGGTSALNRVTVSSINDLALNNQDEVVYLGSDFRNGVITNLVLTRANQPDVILASGFGRDPSVPPTDVPFSLIGVYPTIPSTNKDKFAIDNRGKATFIARERGSGTLGIFTSDGDLLTTLVSAESSTLDVNDRNQVIISTGDAIRLLNSDLHELTTIVDSSGSLSKFSTPAINNNGDIAFRATLNGGETGIFTGADPIANKVIATGDSLLGSTVNSLSFLRTGLNNNGQIVFSAQLADGTQGIFRADRVAETAPPQPAPPVEDAI